MTLPDGTSWLTLGGYMASDKFWSEFEKGWVREVLQKREPHAPYLHATDTVSGNGLFKGWEFERRRQLIMDAVDFLQWLPKKAFCATVCSIDETACKKLKAEGCAVEGAHYICGHWSITQSFDWYYDTHPERIETAYIYFDQGERFMHPFRQRWQRENKTGRRVISNVFWGLIADVATRDMRDTPALQAADLIAWGTSRRRAGITQPFLHLATIVEQVVPIRGLILDEKTLREKHCSDAVVLAEDAGDDLPERDISGGEAQQSP